GELIGIPARQKLRGVVQEREDRVVDRVEVAVPEIDRSGQMYRVDDPPLPERERRGEDQARQDDRRDACHRGARQPPSRARSKAARSRGSKGGAGGVSSWRSSR